MAPRNDDAPGATIPGGRRRSKSPGAEDPLLGATVLGQYEVLSKIGDGGYGTVYLAEQVGLGRKAVLKVVNTETDEDGEVVLRRFEREARALAALEQPHFVRLYNFGQLDDGRPFLAMEYGGDTNVADEIRKLKRLKPERALDIAEQVCEALEEAHRRGIVHRDLKPQNILLGRREGRDWVKVVDLGIAKIMDTNDDTGGKLTGAGIVVGTPAYFSPEQCHGVGLDGRSDLYTLAVVLYEMLSGRLPVQGKSSVDYIRAHVVDTPEPIRKHVPELPKQLEALLAKALEKKPPQRFQSAAELREAIRAVRAKLDTAPAVKPKKKRRFAIAAAAAAVLAAGVGAWALLREEPRGELVIHVTPESADLRLDGHRIKPGRHPVRPGRHLLVARAEGFNDATQVLRVDAEQSVPVNLTLSELGQ